MGDQLILAEAISISGPEMAMILAVLALIVVTTIALCVIACVCALRAGRGSRRARLAFAVVLGIEAVFAVSSLVTSGLSVSLVFVIAMAIEGALYWWGATSSKAVQPDEEPMG